MDNSDVKKLNFQLKCIFNLSGMLKIFKHHSILSSILICHIIKDRCNESYLEVSLSFQESNKL